MSLSTCATLARSLLLLGIAASLTPALARAQAACAAGSGPNVVFIDGYESGVAAGAAPEHAGHGHHDRDFDLTAPTPEGEPRTANVPSGGEPLRWSSPATWGGALPGPTSNVVIQTGSLLLLDTDAAVRSITVCGELRFDRRNLALSADWIMVHGDGKLAVGSEAEPFEQRATITLNGSDPTASVMGMGTKLLGTMARGKIEIIGPARTWWTRLGATVTAGSRQIRLASATDWRVGERIVIASSDYNPAEAEQRTIIAIDGALLTLDTPLAFRHFGEIQTFAGRSVDTRAPVALLDRNVVIQGDAGSTASGFGGHVMLMGSPGASVRVRGIRLDRMGQFNRLGRYPFHWHLRRNAAGDYIRGAVVTGSLHRGIVIHGTDNVVVEDNVVFDTPGHSYMTEDGSERGNTFRRNLGLLTRAISTVPTDPVLRSQNNNQAATFWIKGPNNRFIDNVAAGGEHTAYWFDDVGRVDAAAFEFRGNSASSYLVGRGVTAWCCAGDKGAIWITGDGYDGPHGPFNLEQNTLYKNNEAFWAVPVEDAQGPAEVDLHNSLLVGNRVGTSSYGLRDSLIVGESALGNDSDLVGVMEYGGTTRLDGIRFVNFSTSGATIYQHRNCHREAGNVEARGIVRQNAKLQMCANSEGNDTSIDDIDGSLSGSGTASALVPGQASNAIMYTAACTVEAGNVRRCPGRAVFLSFSASAGQLVRDDGATFTRAHINAYPHYWTLIGGRTYSLTHNLSQGRVQMSAWNKYESDEDQNRRALLSLPTGVVPRVNACRFSYTGPCTDPAALPQAANLAALGAVSAPAYWYDAANARVHVALFTDAARDSVEVLPQ